MPVAVEIEPNGKHIEVWFPFSTELLSGVKSVPGSRFTEKDKSPYGAPYWRVPLDMESCKALRAAFGSDLVIGDQLKAWARREVQRAEKLGNLASATDAELDLLPSLLPALAKMLRGYQKAGAKFIAEADGVILADQPGLGKTVETIAGIAEGGLLHGWHLVVAPKTATATVWKRELEKFQPHPVWVARGSRKQREATIADFIETMQFSEGEEETGGWLVVNPAMVRYRSEFSVENCTEHWGGEGVKILRKCDACEEVLVPEYPELHAVAWGAIIDDEGHRDIRNPKTLTAKAMYKLDSQKRIGLSGTPMTNQLIDLWGWLHWIRPDVFTSKWRWAETWLEIDDNGWGKKIGGLQDGKEDAFTEHLRPYLLRRTKAEVAPELPPKVYQDLWLEMEGEQLKQYLQMAEDAEVRIAEENLTATSVLAEFTRLKQFAGSACTMVRDDNGKAKLYPTTKSNKYNALLELLDERGIRPESKESKPEGTEKVIVFSQFSEMADMIHEELNKLGIETLKITGDVSEKKRDAAQDAFQAEDGPRVIVMVTTAGGVAITLDRADSVIFFDETWSPADQEQAEDRAHRISRVHNVTIYYLRSKGSIDQYIMDLVDEKGNIHKSVLDDRRVKLRP